MTIPSVSAYLTRLLTIVFLPLAVFATGILVWGAQQQKDQADSRLVDSAVALALALDQQLSAKGAALTTLAQSGSIREGDLQRFYDFAKRVGNHQESSIVMWAPSGQQIINTRVPLGTPLPIGVGAANVAGVVRTGKASVSDLFTGAVALQAHSGGVLTFKTRRRALDRYSIAAMAVALSIVVRSMLDPLLGDGLAFTALFPAVALAVWYGGLGPGIFATVLGYVAANYFFIESRLAWESLRPVDATGLILYLFSSLLIVWMGHRMRNAELAEAQRAAQARAMEAQLREADTRKDTFLATLAHELRNPLAAIRNVFEFLNQQGREDAPAQRVRDIATRQVVQLTRLVDDLLDMSRITLGKIELNRAPIPIGEVLNDAVEAMRPLFAKRQQTVNLKVSGEPAWVDADRERLTQVITNILTNSAKYTPAGGHIDIASTADDNVVIISVRDDGIGIAPEFLPRIFDPFQQANPVSSMPEGGLGIGLTLVKELIGMHGGTVEAMSAGSDQGSLFTIRVPRITAPAVVNTQAGDATGMVDPAGAGRNVIVVDDNRDAAETTAMVLRLMGHAVRTAHGGAEALELARRLPPDAMIVDLGMPGMSGYDVAREVRATTELSSVLLIAVTGWGEDGYRQKTAAAGFDHHLVKPADPVRLDSLIAATPKNPAASAAA